MTILQYEHHTDVIDVHDALNRFGTFAETCGWVINQQYTDVGTWVTTGWDAGSQTYLMLTSMGAVNGNNVEQVARFQFLSEHRTEGTSGDQGTVIIRGRLNSETTDIIGNSDHPIWQHDWGPNDLDYSRSYMKGTAPPNVWFFGNERFLAFHYDNDGVHNSQFHVGVANQFDDTTTVTDGAFIHQQYSNSSRLEWDSSTFMNNANICCDGSGDFTYRTYVRFWEGTRNYNYWRVSPVVALTNVDTWETLDISNTNYGIGTNTGNLFRNYNSEGGYRLPYANARLVMKPTVFTYNPALGWWVPWGEIDAYLFYCSGLKAGDIFTHGVKQFMGFHGFKAREIGWAYRIA